MSVLISQYLLESTDLTSGLYFHSSHTAMDCLDCKSTRQYLSRLLTDDDLQTPYLYPELMIYITHLGVSLLA